MKHFVTSSMKTKEKKLKRILGLYETFGNWINLTIVIFTQVTGVVNSSLETRVT